MVFLHFSPDYQILSLYHMYCDKEKKIILKNIFYGLPFGG